MRFHILATLLSTACGEVADGASMARGALCGGYIEGTGSPRLNDTSECWRVDVRLPDNAQIASLRTDSCDVEEQGSRCMIVAPGDSYRIWLSVGNLTHAKVDREPMPCDTVCP